MALHDCISKDASEAVILLVGSQEAYDAAKLDRSRFTQAILKVDQSFACDDDIAHTLDNACCLSFVAALGAGIVLPGHESVTFNMATLRYGKVIIVTELSEEGTRLRNEIVRFFFLWMRPLVSAGHVFLLTAPLPFGFTQAEFFESVLDSATRHLKLVVDGGTWEDTLAQLN